MAETPLTRKPSPAEERRRLLAEIEAIAAEAGVDAGPYPMGSMLMDSGIWALVSAGAACAGAWTRFR